MSVEAPPPRAMPAQPPVEPDVEASLIDDRLRQTRRQLRRVDVATSLLTLAIGVFVYLFLAVLADQWLVPGGWGTAARVLLCLILLAGGGAFLYLRILRPLLWPINPVYVAKAIEQNRPTLKNGLINFLLLRRHRQPVPAVITHEIERYAARQLADVAPEDVVDRHHILVLSYGLTALLLVGAIYYVVSPKNPFTSVYRVLAPFGRAPAPTRVQFRDIRPGDVVALDGQHVVVSAEVDGLRKDETPMLYFTTADRQAVDQAVPMAVPKGGDRHEASLPPDSAGLRQNLTYYLAAGDSHTPQFAVTVEAAPTILVESVEYDYPDYTGLPTRTAQEGFLRALEGTVVTLRAKANTPIDRAEIDLGCRGVHRVPMKPVDRSATGRFTLRLDPNDPALPEHDCYQLRYTDAAGRENLRPIRYEIEVIADVPPDVRLVDPPEERIQLPVNAVLPLAVRAEDPDFALSEVSVHAVRSDKSLPIAPLFRAGRERPPHQGVLEGVFQFKPAELGLKPGDEVVYWAEAKDNKAPIPGRGETERRWITIVEPDPNQPAGDQGQAGANDQRPPDQQPAGDQPQDQQRPGQEEGQGRGAEEQQTPGNEQQSGGDQQSDDKSQQGADEQGKSADQQPNPGDEKSGDQQGKSADEQEKSGQEGPSGNQPQQPADQQQGNQQQADQQGNQGQSNEQNQSSNQPKPGEQSSSDSRDQQGQPKGGQPSGADQQKPQQEPGEPGEGNEGQGPGQDRPGSSQSEGAGGKKDAQSPQDSQQPSEPIDGETNPGDVIQKALDQRDRQQPGDSPQLPEAPARDSDQQGASSQDASQRPGPSGQSDQTPSGQQPNEQDPGQQKPGDQPSGGQGPGQKKPGEPKPDQAKPDEATPGQRPDERQKPGDEGSGGSQRGDRKPTEQPAGADDRPGEKNLPDVKDQPGREGDAQAKPSAGGQASDQDGRALRPDEIQPGMKVRPEGYTDEKPNAAGEIQPGPSGGGGGEPGEPSAPPPADQTDREDPFNREYARKRTVLALEYLKDQLAKDKPDQKLLDSLGGWTRDDLEKFTRRWEAMFRRAGQAGDEGQKAQAQLDEAIKSLGLHRGRTELKAGGADDQIRRLRAPRRIDAPAEWQDQVDAYRRGVGRER